ncbi:serine/arginine repetitive matrix protein 2-like [Ylistrum balloti]|uniref:serine/arginine repetitive matrix protein 2-like n=1 Tax=Ylistrum balloti TaxID=509963 RepID=UPI002905D757|nr:serine/arginine repetitive matrix protein 2-like [Ylistrum balloti]
MTSNRSRSGSPWSPLTPDTPKAGGWESPWGRVSTPTPRGPVRSSSVDAPAQDSLSTRWASSRSLSDSGQGLPRSGRSSPWRDSELSHVGKSGSPVRSPEGTGTLFDNKSLRGSRESVTDSKSLRGSRESLFRPQTSTPRSEFMITHRGRSPFRGPGSGAASPWMARDRGMPRPGIVSSQRSRFEGPVKGKVDSDKSDVEANKENLQKEKDGVPKAGQDLSSNEQVVGSPSKDQEEVRKSWPDASTRGQATVAPWRANSILVSQKGQGRPSSWRGQSPSHQTDKKDQDHVPVIIEKSNSQGPSRSSSPWRGNSPSGSVIQTDKKVRSGSEPSSQTGQLDEKGQSALRPSSLLLDQYSSRGSRTSSPMRGHSPSSSGPEGRASSPWRGQSPSRGNIKSELRKHGHSRPSSPMRGPSPSSQDSHKGHEGSQGRPSSPWRGHSPTGIMFQLEIQRRKSVSPFRSHENGPVKADAQLIGHEVKGQKRSGSPGFTKLHDTGNKKRMASPYTQRTEHDSPHNNVSPTEMTDSPLKGQQGMSPNIKMGVDTAGQQSSIPMDVETPISGSRHSNSKSKIPQSSSSNGQRVVKHSNGQRVVKQYSPRSRSGSPRTVIASSKDVSRSGQDMSGRYTPRSRSGQKSPRSVITGDKDKAGQNNDGYTSRSRTGRESPRSVIASGKDVNRTRQGRSGEESTPRPGIGGSYLESRIPRSMSSGAIDQPDSVESTLIGQETSPELKSPCKDDSRSQLESPVGGHNSVIQEPVIMGRETPRSAHPSGLARQLSAGSRSRSSWSGIPQFAWGSPKLEPNVSILRTSSFLQRARELQELERNRQGTQDDTILPKDTNNSASVKSRQRRIESFHGTRRLKNNSSSSSTSSNSVHSSPHDNNKQQSAQQQSPQQPQSPHYSIPHQQSPVSNQNLPGNQQGQSLSNVNQNVKGDNSEQDMESATAAKLKGWATVEDLTQKHQRQLLLQQQQLQGQQVTTSVAPSNNVNQVFQGHNQYPSGHLSPAMSSPSINTGDHWKGGYGHGTPSSNSHVVPSSSPAMTKQGVDLNEGYATTSTPRSPTNSTNYMPKFPNRPTNLTYTKSSSGYGDHLNKGSYSYNSRPSPHQPQHGSSMYINDDISVIKTPVSSSKKYERRSLPPQLNDYQNLKDLRTNSHSYGMLPHKEEEEGNNPLSKQPDGHSPSSPPPPPRRDMSSLKYVQASSKNHEKYPSWPVTHPNMDMEAGEAITSQVGAWPVRDKPHGGDSSTADGQSYQPQLKPVNEGANDSDRKNGEDNKRNQSDPGFNKPNSFKGLSVKRPTPQEIQQSWNQNQKINTKQNNKSVDNFFLNNSPGYPKPLLDQDGNRIGDAKYSIPSPPERDNPAPDTKLLQEKLATMMAPHSESSGLHPRSGKYLNFDPSRVTDSVHESKDTKSKGFRPSSTGHTTSQSQSASSVSRVDSSTSPLQSPMESNYPSFSSPSVSESKDRPSENLQQVSSPRGVIVKHMLYYNTGTQTDTNSQGSRTNVHVTSKIQDKDTVLQEKSIQAHLSDKDTRNETNRSAASNFGTKYMQGLKEDTKKGRNSSESKDNFSEEDSQNYAPMIRKLSQEYMSGRMQGGDKRLSGDSGVFTVSATSPGSDIPPHSFGQFLGMREAESYNSIVIHPNETSHPFGKDYQDSEHEGQGRIDSSKMELDRRLFNPSDSRVGGHKGRYSMDSSFSQKILPNKKSLQDTRYSSDANLQSTYANQRMHSMSMSSLAPKHSKADSVSEGQYLRPTHRSSNSSSSSSRHGSETRSSASSYHGSLNSPGVQMLQGQGQHRTSQQDSDSVFLDPDVTTSPNFKQSDVSSPNMSQMSDSGSAPSRRSIGRNTSMKLAYGTYDEASRKFEEPGQKSSGRQIVHGKSRSYSGDYMQMNNNQNRPSLGQIREDSSEGRWADVVSKSRSLHLNTTSSVSEESNYANIDPLKMEKNLNPELIERSNLKRTTSEQIRPLSGHGFDEIRPPLPNRDSHPGYHSAMKHSKSDTWQKPVQSPTQSQSDLNSQNFQSPSTSQMDLNPESDTEVKKIVDSHTSSAISSSVSQSQIDMNRRSDSYINEKQKQRNAVQDFMERKTGKRLSDSDDTPATTPEEPKIAHSSSQDRSSPKLTPTQSFREKYARRQESLRRSRSITSRDSSDYVHMSRPSQPHPQTEWSKIRSQAQDGSKRPHSISSDISLVDPYAVTPITEASKQQDIDMEAHKRSKSDSTDVGTTQDLSQQRGEDSTNAPTSRRYMYRQTRCPPPSHYRTGGSLSGSSLDYANVGYRRPPPPPPVEDDKPPALPPRNYRHASTGQLENTSHASRTSGYLEPVQRGAPEIQTRKPRESSPDSYAQQLRIQYRRFSEQQNLKPTTMSVVSSRPVTHCSQSQKRSSLEPQEATSPTTGSSLTSSVGSIPPHQMTYASTTNHILTSQASSPNQTMTSSHASPLQQSSPRSSVSHISTPVSLALHVTPPKDNSNVPKNASQNYSPPMQLCSPELPPPPTPVKNPEELAAIHDLDLPAPPPEVMSPSGESSLEGDDRCADDSYGSHKTRSARQVGVYSRSKSTTLLTENNNYKQQIQKPPRRHLNNQGWKSENAINIPPLDLDNNVTESEFVTAESAVTPTINSRPLGNSQSSSTIMAPRTFMTSDHSRQPAVSSEKEDTESPSVKDRIFRFEKTPSNNSGENKARRSASSVNNLKKSFEDRTKPSELGTDSPRQGNQYSSKYRSRYDGKQEVTNQASRSSREHHSSGSDKSDYSVPFSVEKKRMNCLGQYGLQGNGYSHQSDQPHRKGSAERGDDSVGALQRNSDSSENVHRQDVSSYNQITPDRVSYNRPERPDISPNSRLESSPHLSDRYNNESTPPKVPERIPISHRPVPQPEAPSPINRETQSYGHHKSSSSSSDLSEGHNTPLSVNHGRQPSQEELECNEKVQEFARQLKDKDKKLSEMLNQDDLGRMKFMSGIVPPAETPRKHSSGHSPQTSKLSTGSNEDSKVSTPNGIQDNTTDENSYGRPKEKGSPPSTYWVSPSKAQIEIDIRNSEELGKKMTEDIVDPESLLRTKEELVSSIVKKMDKLKDEKSDLQIEIKEVDSVGKMVSETVEQKCKSQKEKDKFQSFLREMDHIIRLLLKVSGLLARAENALQSLPEDCDVHQKDIATQKRDRYKAQHEEAQKLKQDIDQRSTQIFGILRESLSDQELEDYQYYIKMKSRLTVEHQNLEDKITLGQEQIQALRRSIPDKRH